MGALGSDARAILQRHVLWSPQEEDVLRETFKVHGANPPLEAFEDALRTDAPVFVPGRKAIELHTHFEEMKHFGLLAPTLP
jgi:hypothetical protein